MARRTGPSNVLITGLGTFWGGRVAKALEADDRVGHIIGLDVEAPTIELDRTEYVRTDQNYSILSRIVEKCGIDTILHTFLVVDPTQFTSRRMHEINVIGTMNLFAAASAPNSTVRTVVVKSSAMAYGTAPEDPTWFSEDTPRSHNPRSTVERSIAQVEGYVRDFNLDNPEVAVSVLRFANVLGADIRTPLTRALELPLVPTVFGFDPRLQFAHEEDVVRSILFAMNHRLAGTYNVAGDGLLPWSEVISMVGKRPGYLPAIGADLATLPLQRLGLIDLPPAYLALLRYGRGIDNSKLKAAGFKYDFTSAQSVDSFVRALRLRRTMGRHRPKYRYESDVEQFFRHSPAVIRNRAAQVEDEPDGA
ncbi:MAG: NAD-dependent epimerase/dehydratase family protein [Candidatus Microthrix parvicella]|nr:NAD-dependent epimerase/dehydratase family protein [Candidatus Microthrix parvicella]